MVRASPGPFSLGSPRTRRRARQQQHASSRRCILRRPRPWNPGGPSMPSRHPVNQLMVDNATRGERVADAVSGFMGSWRFIILQTLIVIAWVAGNVYLLFHFDPYPFIF